MYESLTSVFKNMHDMFNRYKKKKTYYETKDIYPFHADVTSSDHEVPCVGTCDLSFCAGIAIYDASNTDHKVGGVAHILFDSRKSALMQLDDAFALFEYFSEDLIRKADEIGGEKYKFLPFNIDSNFRTKKQNARLRQVVKKTIDKLKKQGKIDSVEYRDEQNFKLDTRSGEILPYSYH